MLGLDGPPQELRVKRIEGKWHVTGPRDGVWVNGHHKLDMENESFIDGQCDSEGKEIFELLEESIEKIESEIETNELTTMGSRTKPHETNDPATVIGGNAHEATTAGTTADDVDKHNDVIKLGDSTVIALTWRTAGENGWSGRSKGVGPLVLDGKKAKRFAKPQDALTCLYTLRKPFVSGSGLQVLMMTGVQFIATGTRGPEWQLDADKLIPLMDVIQLQDPVATPHTPPADKTVYVATLTVLRPSPRAHMNYAVLIPVYEVGSSASGKMAYKVGGTLFLLPFSQITEIIGETTLEMQKDATKLVVQNPSILVPPPPGENTVSIDQKSFNEHFPSVAAVSVPPVRKKKRCIFPLRVER